MKLYNKILVLILSLFLINCSEKSEVKMNEKDIFQDSLASIIENIKKNDTSSKDYIRSAKYLIDVLKSKENNKLNRDKLSNIVNDLNKLNEWRYLKLSNKLLLEWSIKSNDTLNIANSYYYYGNSYFNKEINDSAFLYYSKAEKLFLKIQNDKLGDLYLSKSNIQLNFNDNLGAENSAAKSLKYYRIKKNLYGEYDALTNIGIASYGNENFVKAIEYHRKALELAKNDDIKKEYHLQEISLNNIGNCFQNLKNYNEAIFQFKKALKNEHLYQNLPSLYATLTDNLAYSEFKLNGNKEQILNLLLTALKIRDSLQLDSRIVYSKIHLSEYYFNKKDTILAQKYSKEALELSKKTRIFFDLLISLKQSSLVDHRNSSIYSKEYIKISDSLQLEERKSKDKFARIAFETDEIIQQKDKLTEQNRTLLYFFIGTLFLGILLFVIRSQRAKNRELLLKQQQQKINEEIYNLMISQQATIEENRVKEKKRIAQELHDGVLGRLFGARLNLDSLNRFGDDESIASRFNYLSELKNIEQDIREISHDLNREKYVLINNFVAIVSNLLEEQSSSFEAEVTSSIDDKIKWEALNNTAKINLYRILQESLQNVNKYANAKNIHVAFQTDNEFITLKITDDGDGFEVSGKKKGIGLQNMLSRTNECDGVFDIKSKKGKGTTVVVTIPIIKKTIEI